MAIAFVNAVASFPGTSLSALAVSAGNLVVVGIRYNHATASISGLTDTAANTYVSAGLRVNDGVNDWLEVWYAQNTTAHATDVITVAFTGGPPSFVGMAAAQYSGLALTAAKDVTASGVLAGNPVVSGAFTTTSADEVIVGLGQVAATGATWSIPAGVLTTIRIQDSPDHVMVLADAIVSAVQTGVTARLTSTSATNKALAVVTFIAALGPAASVRVTQDAMELVTQPVPDVRLTQAVIELLATTAGSAASVETTQFSVVLL